MITIRTWLLSRKNEPLLWTIIPIIPSAESENFFLSFVYPPSLTSCTKLPSLVNVFLSPFFLLLLVVTPLSCTKEYILFFFLLVLLKILCPLDVVKGQCLMCSYHAREISRRFSSCNTSPRFVMVIIGPTDRFSPDDYNSEVVKEEK